MVTLPFNLQISKNNILIVLASVIVLYLFIHYTINGISSQPSEGDSVHMHIPTAKALIAGKLFSSKKETVVFSYPASSEAILAAFMLLHVPLDLYNVLAIVVLFFAIVPLGQAFGLSKNSSLMLAFSLCSLYGVLRYADTQKIDIWLLVFYAFSLLLLQKPEKKLSYFVKLGFTLGMVAGSKYSGPFWVILLLGFYFKNVIQNLNWGRLFAFLVPFSLVGLSWYIRNIIVFGDPFFPQAFLFFKGDPHVQYYAWPYWKIAISFPGELFNALISEYMVWVYSIVLLAGMCIGNLFFKQFQSINPVRKVLLLGLVNFVYFLFLPAAPIHNYTAIVYDIRISFPALLTMMLTVFCIAKIYKQTELLMFIAFGNMFFVISTFPYHPKAIFFFVLLFTVVLLWLARVLKISFAENGS